MKKVIFATLLVSLGALANPLPSEASVDTYDGVIHLSLTGTAAQRLYESLRIAPFDNGAFFMKQGKNVSCDQQKNSNQYTCSLAYFRNGDADSL